MTADEIYKNLCIYDERYPLHNDLDLDNVKPDDCHCDNCFYGRNKLALHALKLREEIASILITKK